MLSANPRRAIVLVIDGMGVGALPDAAAYGDEATNTLGHLAEALGGLQLPTLAALGLGSILSAQGIPAVLDPAIHGRLHPLGPGKDSVTGHWELMGVSVERALPTYPEGLPPEAVAMLVGAMGHEVICNRPHNGLAAIEQFGDEHLRSGALILYTSKDSVMQLAAHVERIPPQELYRACAAAREALGGEHAVGRVIARPFDGAPGGFERTEGRRDFALRPPGESYLQKLQECGRAVHGVGKIGDLFAGVGLDASHPGASNAQALESVEGLLEEVAEGLIFVNLIDTDQVHGHRKDLAGFARALELLDAWLGRRLGHLRAGDLLVVTADHGVDPAHPDTDHTREYAPLMALSGEMLARRGAGARMEGFRHDGPLADVGATALDWLGGGPAEDLPGESFLAG